MDANFSSNEAFTSIKSIQLQHLPSLSVTNDQLSLATANGHQTVHGFDAGLHGLPHGDARDDARGLQTHTPTLLGAQGSLGGETKTDCNIVLESILKKGTMEVSNWWSDLAIDGVSQSIHNTAEQLLSDRNVHNSSRSLDDVTLLDEFVVTEHHNTNVIGLQVQRHSLRRETNKKKVNVKAVKTETGLYPPKKPKTQLNVVNTSV